MPNDESTPTETLREIFDRCHQTAKNKGWWGPKRDEDRVAACLALIHSEVSEALEEVRKGPEAYDVHYQTNADDPFKPEGMVVELADAVIRIADLCGALNLDLADALITKMKYNETRSHRHGGKKL